MSSYFWDRATDAGIIADETAITWVLKPADLIKAATQACATPVSGLAAAFPKVCGSPPAHPGRIATQKTKLCKSALNPLMSADLDCCASRSCQ